MDEIPKTQAQTEREVWVNGKAGLKQGFITLMECVDREGRDDLLYYLQNKTDFFNAPGSANGHNNYPGGLVEHVLTTYFRLRDIWMGSHHYQKDLYESLIIVALLHDVCKANFYVTSFKQKKEVDPVTGVDVLGPNGKAIWNTVQQFSIVDQFPLGHGEKSVITIMQFMKLTPHEIMAIRWHMGGFDDAARSYAGGLALNAAMQKFPLVTYLHCADLLACLPEPDPIGKP